MTRMRADANSARNGFRFGRRPAQVSGSRFTKSGARGGACSTGAASASARPAGGARGPRAAPEHARGGDEVASRRRKRASASKAQVFPSARGRSPGTPSEAAVVERERASARSRPRGACCGGGRRARRGSGPARPRAAARCGFGGAHARIPVRAVAHRQVAFVGDIRQTRRRGTHPRNLYRDPGRGASCTPSRPC